MIAVAIVGIATQFGSSSGVSWVISGMYIATAVTAPMAGRLGALFGARRVYLTGLALVAIGSIFGMFAPDVGWLVGAYVVLGMGISAHMPNAMTMIRSYADHYQLQPRTAIMTLVLCSQSFAALGPSLGGLLVGTFGWESILWVNLPLVVLSAVAVMRADVGFAGGEPNSGRRLLYTLDLPGIALFVLLITSTMLFLLSLGQDPSWWMLPVLAAVLGLFVARERRSPEPFIDVRALARNRALSATLGRTLLTYTTFYSIYFGIPQWLQYVRGMTAIEAGLTMLPVALVGMVSTMAGSRTYRLFGPRCTLVIGTCALLVGGVLLAVVERSTAPLVVLLLVAAVLGIPNGFNNIGNQNLINSVTSVAEVGAAIGMYRTVQFMGANLAIAALQLTAGPIISDDGLHRTGWFIAASAAALLTGVLFSRSTAPRTPESLPDATA